MAVPSSKPEKPPVKLPGAEGIPPCRSDLPFELAPSPLTAPFPEPDALQVQGPILQCNLLH